MKLSWNTATKMFEAIAFTIVQCEYDYVSSLTDEEAVQYITEKAKEIFAFFCESEGYEKIEKEKE